MGLYQTQPKWHLVLLNASIIAFSTNAKIAVHRDDLTKSGAKRDDGHTP